MMYARAFPLSHSIHTRCLPFDSPPKVICSILVIQGPTLLKSDTLYKLWEV
jgi:hypothetical protein